MASRTNPAAIREAIASTRRAAAANPVTAFQHDAVAELLEGLL